MLRLAQTRNHWPCARQIFQLFQTIHLSKAAESVWIQENHSRERSTGLLPSQVSSPSDLSGSTNQPYQNQGTRTSCQGQPRGRTRLLEHALDQATGQAYQFCFWYFEQRRESVFGRRILSFQRRRAVFTGRQNYFLCRHVRELGPMFLRCGWRFYSVITVMIGRQYDWRFQITLISMSSSVDLDKQTMRFYIVKW